MHFEHHRPGDAGRTHEQDTMTNTLHLHTQDATWRSGVARARVLSCSVSAEIGNGNVYIAKPATMAAFPVHGPARRGAPPQ
jgi:hypothetical protein